MSLDEKTKAALRAARFEGIKRDYTQDDVKRLSGSV